MNIIVICSELAEDEPVKSADWKFQLGLNDYDSNGFFT